MSAVVEAADLHRSYPSGGGTLEVLRGVDLVIEPAELVVLHGRSGSGKTTLLNIVGGIDRPDRGSLRVCGSDLTALDADEVAAVRRRSIAFVFQAFGLLPVLSASENVEVPLRLQGVPNRDRREMVGDVLAAVGLAQRARHRPGELSGGEQQRVAIARALVAQPDLLIADEPTGQLDAATGRQIMGLLENLAADRSLALLVATHDQSIADTATRRLHLEHGRIEA